MSCGYCLWIWGGGRGGTAIYSFDCRLRSLLHLLFVSPICLWSLTTIRAQGVIDGLSHRTPYRWHSRCDVRLYSFMSALTSWNKIPHATLFRHFVGVLLDNISGCEGNPAIL